jgi:hypothetical protein
MREVLHTALAIVVEQVGVCRKSMVFFEGTLVTSIGKPIFSKLQFRFFLISSFRIW